MADQAQARMAVLGERSPAEQPRECDPKQQHHAHTRVDKGRPQIQELARDRRHTGQSAGPAPGVNPMPSGQDGQHQHGGYWQRGHERFRDAAQASRPARAGEPLRGQKKQGRHGQRQQVEAVQQQVRPGSFRG